MIIKNDIKGRKRFDEDVLEWDRCYINGFEITEDMNGALKIRDAECMNGERMVVLPSVSNIIGITRVKI